MFKKTCNVLVACYIAATILIMMLTKDPSRNRKYVFLLLGLMGQLLFFYISYHIYMSKQIWYSVYMYVLIYLVYLLSFTSIDIFFYLDDHKNFSGKIYTDISAMYVDFVYVNFSTVSTMGYSDITPQTTATRAYSCYKIAIAIFIIIFLVSDINIKTK